MYRTLEVIISIYRVFISFITYSESAASHHRFMLETSCEFVVILSRDRKKAVGVVLLWVSDVQGIFRASFDNNNHGVLLAIIYFV